MQEVPDDQRRRNLESDRIISAGLCMGATAILGTRVAVRIPDAAAWFEPHGALRAAAPLFFLAAAMFGLVAFLMSAGDRRRGAAAIGLAAASALMAVGVPFAHVTLRSFIAGATPAWTAGTVALAGFGFVAATAAQDMHPTSGHLRFSAGLTVLALFMAATDPLGVFAGILVALGFLFFTFYRVPSER